MRGILPAEPGSSLSGRCEQPRIFPAGSQETPRIRCDAPAVTTARLLLVDDEDNLRSMLEAALRHFGFEVHPVANGRDALDAVRRRSQPDLIVLDVMLPDLDGFEVCQRLRSRGDRTPVLFLTARDATEDKVRGLTLGGDDYLVKPFSLEELVARINAVLRRTGLDRDRRRAALRRPRDGRRRPPRHPGRQRGGALAHRVQPAALPAGEPGPGACRRRRSSTTCGTTTSAATAAWSRPTSATCAGSSTPSSPASSTPSAASATRLRAPQ